MSRDLTRILASWRIERFREYYPLQVPHSKNQEKGRRTWNRDETKVLDEAMESLCCEYRGT